MPTYGGDEVSGVVLDMGTSTTRAGYAGEETPKVVVPTAYGIVPGAGGAPPTYFFGDHGPGLWRAHMDVRSPLNHAGLHDWPAVSKLLHAVFDREMRLGLPGADLLPDQPRGILAEHPLLVTEPSWNSKENRERMIEMAFEEFDTPAYYAVDRAVMAAFAAGKGTALVVDIGEEQTTVTPISDGFVMRKGIQKTGTGGQALTAQLLAATEARLPTPLYPHFLVASKAGGLALREARLVGGGQTTESFLGYQKARLVQDVKESVCEVFPRAWEEELVATLPARAFEFPSGQVVQYGRERFAVPEALFTGPAGLGALVLQALASCDADLQPGLSANILLSGASSLLPGLVERLDASLRAACPAAKFKLSAPGHAAERKFASWLGGSILTSLGSFHQLWIGKDEYKEQGRSIVHRRCK